MFRSTCGGEGSGAKNGRPQSRTFARMLECGFVLRLGQALCLVRWLDLR